MFPKLYKTCTLSFAKFLEWYNVFHKTSTILNVQHYEIAYDAIPKILYHHHIKICTLSQDEYIEHNCIHSSKRNQVVTQGFITSFCSCMFKIVCYKRLKKVQKRREE